MEYRNLGRSDIEVSALGMGGHEYRRMLNPGHFPNKEISEKEFLRTQSERNRIVEKAIEEGITYFDTTTEREAISLGRALEASNRRKDVVVAAETIFPFKDLKEDQESEWSKIIEKKFKKRLNNLRTEYLDVYNIHCPEAGYSKEKMKETFETLKNLEEENKVRAIGASSHSPKFLAMVIDEFDCFDSVMVPYNYYFQGPAGDLFPVCDTQEIGIVVMKPFAWPYYGVPFMKLSPSDLELDQLTLSQISLRWILDSPEVSTIVGAVNELSELEENLATFEKDEEPEEEILDKCLEFARGPEGREKLKELTKSKFQDLSNYARKAVNADQYIFSVVPDTE